MLQVVQDKVVHIVDECAYRKSLYRIGGVAALIVVLGALVDIAIMFIPGTGTSPGDRTVIDWFTLFQNQWFLGLRDLGILNVLSTFCTVFVFYALYVVHQKINPIFGGLALMLICMGATLYIANNIALSMLTLSREYASAITQQERSLYITAGQTILAQEDISAGSFWGFFISEIAGIVISTVMLRGRIFSRWAAWAGILGESLLLIFNFLAAFTQVNFNMAMIFSNIGGPLAMFWLILIAVKLFKSGAAQATREILVN